MSELRQRAMDLIEQAHDELVRIEQEGEGLRLRRDAVIDALSQAGVSRAAFTLARKRLKKDAGELVQFDETYEAACEALNVTPEEVAKLVTGGGER